HNLLDSGNLQLTSHCMPKSQCLYLREPSLHQELDIILTSNRIPENQKRYSPNSIYGNYGEGQLLGISGLKSS
uniref:Uncharacterized protein n=1 Tax=Peromyscus maniculatus bairdii TaxID=230844 RepID=A0A8C8UIS3_PERMB